MVVLLTVIVPHPPIIIPEVGREEIKNVEKTVNALKKLCKRITKANPDTVVIITPHSALNPYLFNAYSGEKLFGSFARFRAPNITLEFDNDREFIENLEKINPLPPGAPLDHGSMVPLYYLDKAGYKNKVVVINYTAMGKKEHKNFGRKIAETAEKTGRKVVFIASGDLSHRLIPGAPAGYEPDAQKFDNLIVENIKKGNYKAIENINKDLREIAGECGYNSLMVAFGITGENPGDNEVLSYEAPYGVGYVVGIL